MKRAIPSLVQERAHKRAEKQPELHVIPNLRGHNPHAHEEREELAAAPAFVSHLAKRIPYRLLNRILIDIIGIIGGANCLRKNGC